MKPTLTRVMSVLCSALLAAQPYIYGQQPTPSAPPAQGAGLLSPQQLDSLVAPIALFPDPILSQVLVASTYPMEIVQAQRWVSQNPGLKGQQLTAAAAKQPWDASVQALVAMPDLLNRLNQDIGWTSDLGNAFLAQQQDVMAAIQRMRQKAEASGALKSTPQQTVTTATEAGQNFIEIQPANPEYVYLPVYDPNAVWGPPAYPYPSVYYGTGTAIAAGVIGFAAGIAIGSLWYGGWGGWGGWGWRAGWGGGNVIINNNFIRRNNFNRAVVGNGNRWVHNPAHRGAVPYRNPAVANRFNAGRPGIGARPGMGPGAAGALRPGQSGAPGAGMRPTPGQVQQQLQQAGRPGMGARPGMGPGAAGALRGPGMAPGGGAMMRPPQGNVGPRPAFGGGGGGGFRGGGGGFRGGGGGGGGRRRQRMSMSTADKCAAAP